jgi:ferritin
MLKKKVEDILNAQIEKEGYSSNLYLAMASWSEAHGYSGISSWLYAQSDEERIHMLKLIRYVNERGGHAIIPAFKEAPEDQKNITDMFNAVLEHERYITESINNIVAVTLDEKDFTTHSWIQWFVNEQIEEETQVREILDKLKLLGNSSLYLFDRDILSLRQKEATKSSK